MFNIESLQFKDRYLQCRQEFDNLVDRHRNRMKHLTALLKQYTKTDASNFLNEAYIRFNFNNFYVKREDEYGLDV